MHISRPSLGVFGGVHFKKAYTRAKNDLLGVSITIQYKYSIYAILKHLRYEKRKVWWWNPTSSLLLKCQDQTPSALESVSHWHVSMRETFSAWVWCLNDCKWWQRVWKDERWSYRWCLGCWETVIMATHLPLWWWLWWFAATKFPWFQGLLLKSPTSIQRTAGWQDGL